MFTVRLSCVFLLSLGGFSRPLRVPHLFFASASFFYLSLLLSSIGGLSSSSSCFCIGCPGVQFCSWGCYFSCGYSCGSAFSFVLLFPCAAVPAATCSLSLRFTACCGYGWFFRSSSAFPHATAMAAPSCLPQHFRLLQLQLLLPFFVLTFLMLQLWLLLWFFGAAPAFFLNEGSPVAVPQGPVAAFPCISARFLSTAFAECFCFSSVFFL